MSDLCMNDCVRMRMWYSGGRLCSRGSAKFTDGLHEFRSHSRRFFLFENVYVVLSWLKTASILGYYVHMVIFV